LEALVEEIARGEKGMSFSAVACEAKRLAASAKGEESFAGDAATTDSAAGSDEIGAAAGTVSGNEKRLAASAVAGAT
jgi:hypothetical protein